MKPVVYIETSVISYLTARPSRDMLVSAYQVATREWWTAASDRYELVASLLVIAEAGAGDRNAARSRLDALKGVRLLETSPEIDLLAAALVDQGAVPHHAAGDAVHIATASCHAANYLVSWNFRHIANAAMNPRIARVCRQEGYELPFICTPSQLME